MLMYLSFTSYLYVSLAVVGLYYAIILCVFYRTELQTMLLQSKSVTNYSPNKTATGGTTDPLVFDLVDELGALLVQLEAQKCGRLELFPFITRLLQKFPTLCSSDFRNSIIHLVIVECANKLNIHLTANELDSCWQPQTV